MILYKKFLPNVFIPSLNTAQSKVRKSIAIACFTLLLGVIVSVQEMSCTFNANFYAEKSHELHCVQKLASLPDVDTGRIFTSLGSTSKAIVSEFALPDVHAEPKEKIVSSDTWTSNNGNIALYKLLGRFLI